MNTDPALQDLRPIGRRALISVLQGSRLASHGKHPLTRHSPLTPGNDTYATIANRFKSKSTRPICRRAQRVKGERIRRMTIACLRSCMQSECLSRTSRLLRRQLKIALRQAPIPSEKVVRKFVDHIRFIFPALAHKFPVLAEKFPVLLSREFHRKPLDLLVSTPTAARMPAVSGMKYPGERFALCDVERRRDGPKSSVIRCPKRVSDSGRNPRVF